MPHYQVHDRKGRQVAVQVNQIPPHVLRLPGVVPKYDLFCTELHSYWLAKQQVLAFSKPTFHGLLSRLLAKFYIRISR